MTQSDLSALASTLPDTGDWLTDCRNHLEATHARIAAAFSPTLPVAPLLAARSAAIDVVLQRLWRELVARQLPGECSLALFAVGGYGRGELFPHSDIDLLVLSEGEFGDCEKTSAAISALVTALWDLGLHVGHSVRSLADCEREARGDVQILTTTMESRCLAGDRELAKALAAVTAPEAMWTAAEFFVAKLEEREQRHANFGHNEYKLEPNVKSSPGGLRDVQLLDWISRRTFGTPLSEVPGDAYLNTQERQILNNGCDFLYRVRFALHLLTGRDENRLLFDHQRKLASQWGYVDAEKLAVEQFMQNYFRSVQVLGQLHEVLLRLFYRKLLHNADNEVRVIIDDDFEQVENLISARRDTVFSEDPVNLWRLFVLIANNPEIEGIEPETLRLVRASRHLIDDDFRNNPDVARMFIALLSAPYNMTKQIRRLWRHGLLGRYLPEFGRIVGQMQFDMFHTYTVDAHTMEVLAHTRRFWKADYTERFPVSTRIAQRLRRPALLYIAALYHDIGKGRGGDHSELGAVDAEAFCVRHGLNARDTELVTWLVKNHLVMSTVSQRKDISDPEEIQRFASHVATEERLDYLYTLTVADINGTNPELWNAWRASLLRQLYTETRRALRRGLSNPIGRQEVIDATRRAAAELLEYRGFLQEELDELWETRGDDYFLRERPEDIAWHTEAIADHSDRERPLVLVRQAGDSPIASATQIFLHARDETETFAKACAALEVMGLSINDARIYSGKDGATLDTFFVLRDDNTPLDDSTENLERIAEALTEALERADTRTISRRIPRAVKSFHVATETTITQDKERAWTVLEVATRDRPGLLAEIGQVFADQDIALQSAKIQTLGERVEDVFFITDLSGGPIEAPERIDRLCSAITGQLDTHNEASA